MESSFEERTRRLLDPIPTIDLSYDKDDSIPCMECTRNWTNEWHGMKIIKPIEGGLFPSSKSSISSLNFFHKPIRNINAKPRAIYKDLVYILLNLRWSILVLVLTLFYFGITILFALLFHYLCHESDHFLDSFHYSYQSFSTIGFGIVYPKNRCGNYIMVLEMVISMFTIPAMTGLVFSKFSLAKVKLAFSQHGVIHTQYKPQVNALIFRVANASYARNLHQDILMNVSVSLELFRIEDIESPTLRRYHLALKQSEFLMLRLSMQVVHVIDETSPLVDIHPHELNQMNFMIQLTVQGIDSNRHAMVVDQRMYCSNDLHFGHRFETMMFPPNETNPAWLLDFDKLNSIVPIVDEMNDECFYPTAHHAPLHRSHSEPRHLVHHLQTHFLAQTQPLIRVGNIQEEYSISKVGLYPTTLIQAKNAPHFFQYTYYHLLHLRWSRILTGLTILVLFTSVFFGSLHCLEFNKGLYIADTLIDSLTPFELCFFLSIHTLSTVGFGNIAPAPMDHFHNTLVVVEAFFGISLMAIVTGIAWSKFALPQAHIQFSNRIIGTTIHGERCLLFRAVNTRHMGDVCACEFKLAAFFEDRHGVRMMHDLHLVEPKWPSINIPVTLIHIVDASSPLSKYPFDELNMQHIVLLAVFSGFDTTFCETVYARHMYSEFDLDDTFQNVVQLTAGSLVIDWKYMETDQSTGRVSNMM